MDKLSLSILQVKYHKSLVVAPMQTFVRGCIHYILYLACYYISSQNMKNVVIFLFKIIFCAVLCIERISRVLLHYTAVAFPINLFGMTNVKKIETMLF